MTASCHWGIRRISCCYRWTLITVCFDDWSWFRQVCQLRYIRPSFLSSGFLQLHQAQDNVFYVRKTKLKATCPSSPPGKLHYLVCHSKCQACLFTLILVFLVNPCIGDTTICFCSISLNRLRDIYTPQVLQGVKSKNEDICAVQDTGGKHQLRYTTSTL